MRTVTLKGVQVELGLPESMALRTEVWLGSANNELRAGCAALAVCWKSTHKPKVSYNACGYNVMVFGGKVFDWLSEQDIDRDEIYIAGSEALQMIYESLPTKEAIDEAEGFTEPAHPEPTGSE